MSIRSGVKFSDGTTLTPKDVKYSFDLLKIATHPQNALWASTGLRSVRDRREDGRLHVRRKAWNTSSSTSIATTSRSFRSTSSASTARLTSRPATWMLSRCRGSAGTSTSPVLARRLRPSSGSAATTGGRRSSSVSGPAPSIRRRHSQHVERSRARRTSTRGTSTSSTTSPRSSAIKGNVKTFYPEGPVPPRSEHDVLFPNTTKKPLNDPQFRRALAFSINMNQILDKAYQGLVDKASPTGLLPIWNKWIDKKAVAKLGFSYNLDAGEGAPRCRRLQGHGRGRLRREQGRAGHLRSRSKVPDGWSDWMIAIQVISDSAKAAGIKVTPGYPDYGDTGRRPRSCSVRPRPRPTTGSTRTRRGRTTSTSTSCRFWRTRQR